MKKLLIATAVAGSILSASVFAGPVDGVINMQTVFTQAKQLKAASAAMKAKFAPMQAHCQTLTKSLQADMKNLQKNGSTMSKKALAALQKKAQSEQAQVQQCQMSLQQQAMAGQQAAKIIYDFIKICDCNCCKTKRYGNGIPKQRCDLLNSWYGYHSSGIKPIK